MTWCGILLFFPVWILGALGGGLSVGGLPCGGLRLLGREPGNLRHWDSSCSS